VISLDKKKQTTDSLDNALSDAGSVFLVDFGRIVAGHDVELRKALNKQGIFYRVAKNTLVRRAVQGTDYECVSDALKGPLLFAFSKEDPGAAGRLVKDFAKANDKLVPKIVSVGGKLYGAAELERLASLPTRDQALSMLLGCLVQPATMLVRVLSEPAASLARAVRAVGDQKQAAA